MTYPAGAGPYGGRFTGSPWAPSAAPAEGGGASAAQFPRILTSRAVKDPGRARLIAALGPPTAGLGWMVTRLTVSCDVAAVATIYVGGQEPQHVVTGTPAGALDEHDPSSPIPVPYGQEMFVSWTGADVVDGVNAIARIEYYEVY